MDPTLKRKAYLEGLKLKKEGLSGEIIYARLEKQGFPKELAVEVAKNIMVERQKERKSQLKINYNVALVKVGIGVIAALVSYLMVPGMIILPFGILISGIVVAIVTSKELDN